MNTGAGAVYESFNRWKSIPDGRDREGLIKGTKFERKLMVLFRNRENSSFQPMKDIYYDGVAIKKRAVLLLVKS
jgi:hypothetical protein